MKPSLALAYKMKKKEKKMAYGGEMEDADSVTPRPYPRSQQPTKDGDEKKPVGKRINFPGFAEGGEVGAKEEDAKDLNQSKMFSDGDMIVDRAMKKYSKGGKVANDVSDLAGFKPNEFDDLVLRDDLKSTYGEGNNSGDMSGNAQEDHDQDDIVSRVMSSLMKKDRMPIPA